MDIYILNLLDNILNLRFNQLTC